MTAWAPVTGRMEIRPFGAADLVEAASLLARRHRTHRESRPLLSPLFEESAACEAELREAWDSEDASGAVALRGDRMVGFLVGAPRSSPMWGPNVWVEAAGLAAEEPETLRDLYGLAAARWVDEGRTAHYVLAPAPDEAALRAWCRLGFGEQQAHALRAVPTGRGRAARGSRHRPAGPP